jgi:hypothetical protein
MCAGQHDLQNSQHNFLQDRRASISYRCCNSKYWATVRCRRLRCPHRHCRHCRRCCYLNYRQKTINTVQQAQFLSSCVSMYVYVCGQIVRLGMPKILILM